MDGRLLLRKTRNNNNMTVPNDLPFGIHIVREIDTYADKFAQKYYYKNKVRKTATYATKDKHTLRASGTLKPYHETFQLSTAACISSKVMHAYYGLW